eukprot:GHVU01029459.1.p3 GENE.GHVU01029459.1~~GHVU01029459.1.p3  ORF type:complete len:152 (-),score=14.90 GHVU01029459.1:654-1109(-)
MAPCPQPTRGVGLYLRQNGHPGTTLLEQRCCYCSLPLPTTITTTAAASPEAPFPTPRRGQIPPHPIPPLSLLCILSLPPLPSPPIPPPTPPLHSAAAVNELARVFVASVCAVTGRRVVRNSKRRDHTHLIYIYICICEIERDAVVAQATTV